MRTTTSVNGRKTTLRVLVRAVNHAAPSFRASALWEIHERRTTGHLTPSYGPVDATAPHPPMKRRCPYG
jgi:hypothetical protein